jgi:uncharacterized membrane protein YgdD (TMEM256/DUF423 family)/predicted kinase
MTSSLSRFASRASGQNLSIAQNKMAPTTMVIKIPITSEITWPPRHSSDNTEINTDAFSPPRSEYTHATAQIFPGPCGMQRAIVSGIEAEPRRRRRRRRSARTSNRSTRSLPKESSMPRYALVLATVAALLGVAGVALAALSTHADGGELGRTAAQFLVLHAGVLIGVTAHARVADRRTARALLGAGGALAFGTLVFSGDLTMRAFAGARLFPMAAPIGGSLMILSWIALSLVFAVDVMRDETQGESMPDPPATESVPDLRPRQGMGARLRLSLVSKVRAFRRAQPYPRHLRGLAFGKSPELRRPPGADGRDKPGYDDGAALYAPENLILAPMPRQGELMSDPRPAQGETMPDPLRRQGEAAPDPRPTLYLFCGKIAAGKSALASRLSRRPATVLISEDLWNANLFQAELKSLEDYARYSKRLRAAMGPHVVSLLKIRVSVVLDFPANGVGIRRWMRGIFEEADAAHELHYLDVSDEVCKGRLRERNAAGQHPFQTGEADYELFTSYFTPPSPEEGFDVIVHRK